MIGFENQLTTAQERDVFFVLEVQSRSPRTIEQLTKAFDDVAKLNPFIVEFSWFEPLKNATVEFHQSSKDDYLSIRSYIRSLESTLIKQARRGEDGLASFTENELDAPHMQWLRILNTKRKEYQDQFPNLSPTACVAMARYSTLGELTNDELYKLRKCYMDDQDGYYAHMEFYQYVEWYEESKKMFNCKGELIDRVSKEINEALVSCEKQDSTNIEYTLQRNYEIHPMLNEHFQAEVMKIRESKVNVGEVVPENKHHNSTD